MTRLSTSTLTLATMLGVSASLAAFATPLLVGSGQAQSFAPVRPAQIYAASAPATSNAAPQFAPGRDGQRTVRIVYAGAVVAR